MMNKFQMGGEVNSVEFSVATKFTELLTGMGTALITTFYGVLLANMMFLPIAGKLKRMSENELIPPMFPLSFHGFPNGSRYLIV